MLESETEYKLNKMHLIGTSGQYVKNSLIIQLLIKKTQAILVSLTYFSCKKKDVQA